MGPRETTAADAKLRQKNTSRRSRPVSVKPLRALAIEAAIIDGTEMAVGEYKLAVQQGLRAAYAHVRLEASDGAFAVDVDAIEAKWRAAAVFGVQYAHDRLGRTGSTATFTVKVTELRWMPSDTTEEAVSLAAYRAACAAFGVAPDERVRLREDLSFEFPA
jgi:hypothetical protein